LKFFHQHHPQLPPTRAISCCIPPPTTTTTNHQPLMPIIAASHHSRWWQSPLTKFSLLTCNDWIFFYCFINYHFGFIYFLKIANWRQKGKYKNNSAIFLSPKMLQPIILETTLNFIFGLQLSSKWSPNGLLFTSKVVSIWSPMETFSSLPISSQPCGCCLGY